MPSRLELSQTDVLRDDSEDWVGESEADDSVSSTLFFVCKLCVVWWVECKERRRGLKEEKEK